MTVSKGMCCSAAGIRDTPLLVIMKWVGGGGGRSLVLEEEKNKRSSLLLTELIIFSEGVCGFKKQQRQQREEWRGLSIRTSREDGDSWCDGLSTVWGPFLNYSSRTVISPPFLGYEAASIWHLWQRALFCSSTGRHRDEPGHWKCADATLLGTVKGAAVVGGGWKRN